MSIYEVAEPHPIQLIHSIQCPFIPWPHFFSLIAPLSALFSTISLMNKHQAPCHENSCHFNLFFLSSTPFPTPCPMFILLVCKLLDLQCLHFFVAPLLWRSFLILLFPKSPPSPIRLLSSSKLNNCKMSTVCQAQI